MVITTKFFIELSMAALMIISLFLLFKNLWKRNQGIGENVIQFTSIALIIPAIVILGLEEVIQKETVAALLSGLGGYGLSNANSNRKNPPGNPPSSSGDPKNSGGDSPIETINVKPGARSFEL